MNPIPLTDRKKHVWAYACKTCGAVHASLSPRKAGPPSTEIAELRSAADACCRCRQCHQPLPAISPERGRCEFCSTKCERLSTKPARLVSSRMKTSETLFKIEHDRRLKLAKNQDAAGLLRLNMRELSESLWCAGWEADLEFTLWKDLDFWNGNHGGDGIHSHSLLYRPEAIKLRTLSRKAGGWWMWWKEPKGCKGVHSSGEVFVPMSEWKKIYAQHCASEGSKP